MSSTDTNQATDGTQKAPTRTLSVQHAQHGTAASPIISDTNQASELFELCKKVYELTEWECGGEYVYHHNDLVDIVQGKPAGDYWENNWWFPLYTLDYLLEKLPIVTEIRKHTDFYLAIYANMRHLTADNIEAKSDTPLKALLKLTIALSEAGGLK